MTSFLSFFFYVCLPLYAIPFLIMVSMPNRRALVIAALVLGLPIIAIIIYLFREVNNPDDNASSFGEAILLCGLALVCIALIAGAITRLILLGRRATAASPRTRAGIMLGCFSCLPALLAMLVI
ncbi:hypothetical protein ACO0LD_28600 [Undibacterium sp. Ji83W]|uniref:hypothetical protein n=1 Tax=Undibacterium sp. Ji83W TaxID=3413043 RepID=UPI003BF13405